MYITFQTVHTAKYALYTANCNGTFQNAHYKLHTIICTLNTAICLLHTSLAIYCKQYT